MPRRNIDYSKTIIYKIVCNDLNIKDIYVGSTTDFTRRKSSHKSTCNNELSKSFNFKVYKYIRENDGWDNWNMVEIEKYSCHDSNESKARERYWIELLKSSLNQYIPTRTQKEANKANKDIISSRLKVYYNKNKTLLHEQSKQYYKENKDFIKEKVKEYRTENNEVINEKLKNNCICGCGASVSYRNISRHKKTEKHIKYLEAQEI
jgi:hypothetical protein